MTVRRAGPKADRAHSESSTPPVAPIPADPPFPHQQRWFLALLAAYALTRLALLFLSQRYLMSDEALVGNMALDILEGKPIPFFFYGQHYGGGHVVEALLMVPLLKLFGPSDLIVSGVSALMGGLFAVVVYATLYRFFSKRLALLSLAVLVFSSAFAAYNFLVIGAMTTIFFSWLGLFFFFPHYYGERPRPVHLLLCGACLGFAFYCFSYALYYIVAVGGLMVYKHRLGLFRRWKELGALAAGLLLGATPLIVYNAKYSFQIPLLPPPDDPNYRMLPGLFRNVPRLLSRDLPSFFSAEISDFLPVIPWPSVLAYAIFCAALLYLVCAMRRPLLAALRGLFRLQPPQAGGREERILCILYLVALYVLVYCLSPFSGYAARYLLPFYPMIPIVVAWAILRLGRSRRGWAAALSALYLASQLWFMGVLARESTREWLIPMDGKDLKQVVKYLDARGINAVMTPYEIKWKLMFHSNHRIACAAVMFGFDREMDVNKLALTRFNQEGAPLVVVLDKEMKTPLIAQHVNPAGAFDLEAFFNFLKVNEITHQATPIGDFVVLHDFSRTFKIYPDFYRRPLVP